MTLEVVNTIASIGTLLVIAATAIAALGQLRHMRGSNQIDALTECREVMESEKFQRATQFVARELPALLEEPKTREALANPPLPEGLRAITNVGNFFESMGGFVKHGIIDADIARDLWAGIVAQSWSRLRPALAIMRRQAGPALWENFEYLASISEEWIVRHPDGLYPPGRTRLLVEDTWRSEDERLGIYKPS
jgi:hypothetical protein